MSARASFPELAKIETRNRGKVELMREITRVLNEIDELRETVSRLDKDTPT